MLKPYELRARHFGWDSLPKPATAAEATAYLLDRGLRAQGIVSLDSICHLDAPSKPAVHRLIERRGRRQKIGPGAPQGAPKDAHWAVPETPENNEYNTGQGVAPPFILSPFDPRITPSQ